jgi:branched-subunit amino acid transport protein
MTAEQMTVTVLVAALVVQALKFLWIGVGKRPKPSEGALRAVAFVVSAILAFLWRSPIALPAPASDPVAFAIALVEAAAVILIFAHLVYDVLLDKILTGLDTLTLARLFKRPMLAP